MKHLFSVFFFNRQKPSSHSKSVYIYGKAILTWLTWWLIWKIKREKLFWEELIDFWNEEISVHQHNTNGIMEEHKIIMLQGNMKQHKSNRQRKWNW